MPWQALGMGVAALGMLLIGLTAGHDVPLFPLLLTLMAALGWAVSNLIVKASPDANGFGLVIWGALIPPIPLALLARLTAGWQPALQALLHSDWKFWAATLFMGLGNTVLGFGIWSGLIQKHGASRVAPLSLLVPVFGMLASAVLLHEGFPPGKLGGAFLVFVGLMLHVFGGKWWRKPS